MLQNKDEHGGSKEEDGVGCLAKENGVVSHARRKDGYGQIWNGIRMIWLDMCILVRKC